ncbi:MAG: dTMP kinase, partial [Chloroflexota bacterium]
MSAAARRGRFISFEGGEASGKSLQAQRLAAALRERGLDVVLVREPGGTPAGERIREILLHTREVALSPEAQALLFTAARAQLVREVIRPALERGAVVVAARYFDSTIAYQGSGLGADPEGLRAITSFAVGDTIPERTFLMAYTPGVSRQRV